MDKEKMINKLTEEDIDLLDNWLEHNNLVGKGHAPYILSFLIHYKSKIKLNKK